MIRKTSVVTGAALAAILFFSSDSQSQSTKKNSDVDDIGNRNINKGNLNFISIEKEIEMGRQLAAQVEREVKLFNDPQVNEYINRVGQNLVRNSDAKVPFTIKVVDSDEVNAFALPGGFFYVNTGLIMAADEEAELAGVMGHEIAHVAARHGTENASKAQLANFATLPLIFVGGPAGLGARQATSMIVPLEFLHFSRNNEAEADYLGLQYMYKAGYDPSAFVSFFEKLQAKEAAKPGTVSKLFATHPPTPDRIAMTKKNIEQILKDRDQYITDTSEFQAIKARIALLQSQGAGKHDDPNKPTLRRTTKTSGDSQPSTDDGKPAADPDNKKTTSDPDSSDDGPPTLKRKPPNP